MFKNNIYVIKDTKTNGIIDSFVGENKEVALRFQSGRIVSALESKAHMLLNVWTDCELWEISPSDAGLVLTKICDISSMIKIANPRKDEQNEKN